MRVVKVLFPLQNISCIIFLVFVSVKTNPSITVVSVGFVIVFTISASNMAGNDVYIKLIKLESCKKDKTLYLAAVSKLP